MSPRSRGPGPPSESAITGERRWPVRRWLANSGAVLATMLIAGCPTAPPTNGVIEDGNRDTSLTIPGGKTSGEPNGSFVSPIVAIFDEAGVARLQGTVSAASDLDVFDVGPLFAGDRLVVDATTPGSNLDTSVAVFDAEQRLVYANDDRDGASVAGLDAFVDFVVRHDAVRYYLVMTNSAFASTDRRSGSYRIDVTVTRGGAVPAPARQMLLLNFDGGNVVSAALGALTLPPFSAGAISPEYAGQTDALKEHIRAAVDQNYERFDVIVLTTDDAPPPAGTEFSTVHFGGFSDSVFGIADDIDLYNADFCDDAIIFAESFTPHIFSRTPTAAELGIAIGNIAAHEAGHLLGLNHVSDDRALMDDQSAADAFLTDQEFGEAPLSRDIMEIGFQDAALLLFETVGATSFP